MQNMPDSLKRIIEKSPNLEHRVRGLPNLGENLIDGQFSKEVNKIYDAFGLYGNELYVLENERIKNISSRSLGGGSPMRTSAFPLCKEALINIISSDELSDYPMAAGETFSLVLPKNEFVYAPVTQGACAGYAYGTINGNVVVKIPLIYGLTVEMETLKKPSFWDRLLRR